MKKQTLIYSFINILALLGAVVIFFFDYKPDDMFREMSPSYICIVATTVIIVHFLKAMRLYFTLYGSDISFLTYLKSYCKATPVSILFPFKSGELFRIYCYGTQTESFLKGVITVILDRFMDTIALITMIITMTVIYTGAITPLVYGLIIFILVVLITFLVFPSVQHYWVKYLLRSDATPRKITFLIILDNINHVYIEIGNVIKGKGIILYVFSLLAWSVEIGSVSILYKLNGSTDVPKAITEYLSSALSRDPSPELKQFIFISVILMIILYTFIKLVSTATKVRD